MRSRRHLITVLATGLLVFGFIIKQGGQYYFIEPNFPTLLDTSFENFTAVPIASFDTSVAKLLVVDLAYKDTLTKRIFINRRMLSADRSEVFISELAMLVPENITRTKLFDTTQLGVDYSKLTAVGQTLVAPPFLMGSLKAHRNHSANVLVLGLGGSQLNNFIHHNFPRLNITVVELEQSVVDMAKQYFGLKQDDTQRVIVMDGIKYLQDAAQQGLKFDAIYIDVCPTRFPHELTIMCPIPLFLDDGVIRQIRQCLTDSGTMISKMLVFTGRVKEESEKIADKYRKHFANCIVTPMPHILNRVLVCSGSKIPKERFSLDVMSKSAQKFYADLGLSK